MITSSRVQWWSAVPCRHALQPLHIACCSVSAQSSRISGSLAPRTQELSRKRHCMSNWAQEWSTALDKQAAETDLAKRLVQTESQFASTHTPHPAAASSREAAEWEAVLTATEQAAAGVAASAAQQTGNERSEREDGSAVYAVIECGSHSTRLLLNTGSKDVARLTKDTHIGAAQQQLQAGSPAKLGAPAMSATLQALREYRAVLHQHDVVGMAAVATAAVRQAADANEFIQQATDILGCTMQVLSGKEEGQLAFLGATASVAHSRCCVVFDLGGNSTEFAVGIARESPTLVVSTPLGCLSIQAEAGDLQRRNAAAACVAAQQMEQAQHLCQQQQQQQLLQQSAVTILEAHRTELQRVVNRYKQQLQAAAVAADGTAGAAVIATGGTITTIAALHQQLLQYEHDAVHMCCLSQEDIQQLMQQLNAEGSKSRFLQSFPWLTAKRFESLLPGCCGVLAVMQQLDVQQLMVSDNDLLDGMLMILMRTSQQQTM